ncbi:MAG: fumarylacetoacetate hydrolase family protein [Pigmentiphaga sp.]|uniref:2-keto-4-pentenoate hydratase n=1 Tax=Pigmentiphaga sp. TaxID=1977564 RepID=UPI0029ABA6BA|nr:fumarylacetoacetate hydrolase family protein [Pigmentiphaga sp.]MDX3904344.1 fumarylacetoacetate hydrolase family protein [Pigmentiphaga sp.]
MGQIGQGGIAAEAIAGLAQRLRGAHESRTAIDPIRDQLPAGDVDAAYAVQQANTDHWTQQGRRLVGRKIGLTSKAVQAQLGVDQPDYGMLFADMSVCDGEEVPLSTLIQPKVEAEIALVMERDLTQPLATMAELISSVAYALPAIEIVDSRIANWKISIVDTIADNASSGLFVLGNRPVKLGDFDARLCGMVMERNGDQVSIGAGAACLGNPLNAALWLARKMAERGNPLRAGDVVLTGALGPMVAVQGEEILEARIAGLGSVRAAFGAKE